MSKKAETPEQSTIKRKPVDDHNSQQDINQVFEKSNTTVTTSQTSLLLLQTSTENSKSVKLTPSYFKEKYQHRFSPNELQEIQKTFEKHAVTVDLQIFDKKTGKGDFKRVR